MALLDGGDKKIAPMAWADLDEQAMTAMTNHSQPRWRRCPLTYDSPRRFAPRRTGYSTHKGFIATATSQMNRKFRVHRVRGTGDTECFWET
jgi:hypothetical protein